MHVKYGSDNENDADKQSTEGSHKTVADSDTDVPSAKTSTAFNSALHGFG